MDNVEKQVNSIFKSLLIRIDVLERGLRFDNLSDEITEFNRKTKNELSHIRSNDTKRN